MASQESSLKASVRNSLNHGQFFYNYGGVIQGSVVFAKYPSLMNGKVKAKRINCFIHAHLRVIGRVNYDRYIPPLVPSDKYCYKICFSLQVYCQFVFIDERGRCLTLLPDHGK